MEALILLGVTYIIQIFFICFLLASDYKCNDMLYGKEFENKKQFLLNLIPFYWIFSFIKRVVISFIEL
jgi:hypothetical protein